MNNPLLLWTSTEQLLGMSRQRKRESVRCDNWKGKVKLTRYSLGLLYELLMANINKYISCISPCLSLRLPEINFWQFVVGWNLVLVFVNVFPKWLKILRKQTITMQRIVSTKQMYSSDNKKRYEELLTAQHNENGIWTRLGETNH